MKIGRLLLRMVVGGLFVGHGVQKLFGWFDGPGPRHHGTGVRASRPAPGTAERDRGRRRRGGRRGAARGRAGDTLRRIGPGRDDADRDPSGARQKGPWVTNGGYEYNLVLIAAALALAEVGPGALSLDAARGRERSGSGWALAALTTGAIGALGSYAMAAAQPAPVETPAEEAEQAASAEAAD